MINSPPPLNKLHAIFVKLSSTPNLKKLKQLHSHLITTNLHITPQYTTLLITLYSKHNLPLHSVSTFHSSPHSPNLFTFNALISSLSSHNLNSQAFYYYTLLRQNNSFFPDKFTYPCTIKACTSLGLNREAKKIQSLLYKLGLDCDKFIGSALVRSYIEFGLFDYAKNLFDELPEKDVVLWNAMVTGFAQKGDFVNAVEFFEKMGIEGISPSSYTVTGMLSVYTALGDFVNGKKMHGVAVKYGFDTVVSANNALIDFYGKCHVVEDAISIFEGMEEKDLFTWNSMLSAFHYNSSHEKTLRLFSSMRRSNVSCDEVTISAVLPACAQAATLTHGREIHSYVITCGIINTGNTFVHNALMDMYAKSGSICDARHVFQNMHTHDPASWNIMIHAYASHGYASEALNLFNSMCFACVAPNEVTFVGLLSACSHAGLVDQGRGIFNRMESEYGVSPVMEHYSCMVDLLGRAGHLEEAERIARKANETGVWRVYLAACKMHGKTEKAEEVVERVKELVSDGSGGSVLLANVYGLDGRFDELAKVRGDMKRRKVKKVVGCSWVEVAGLGMHMFVTGSKDYIEEKGISDVFCGLVGNMREYGYVVDAFVHGSDQNDSAEFVTFFAVVQARRFCCLFLTASLALLPSLLSVAAPFLAAVYFRSYSSFCCSGTWRSFSSLLLKRNQYILNQGFPKQKKDCNKNFGVKHNYRNDYWVLHEYYLRLRLKECTY